jgi:uncharacterized protein with beta-barrel porin domain
VNQLVTLKNTDVVQLSNSGNPNAPYQATIISGTASFFVSQGRVERLYNNQFLLIDVNNNHATLFGPSNFASNPPLLFGGTFSPTSDQVNSALSSLYSYPLLPVAPTTDIWSNNPIVVTLTGGSKIATSGVNAHGIVLQNLGSVGGVWSSNGTKLNMGITLNGSNAGGNTPGGKVTLGFDNSTVKVTGQGARGVVIQSDGAGPGGNADQGQIWVYLNNNSSIYSAQHTALMLVGGSYSATQSQQNKIDVNLGSIINGSYQSSASAAKDNTDSASNKWAVYAPTGYTNLTVQAGSSITGNILLGIATRGNFTNYGTWTGSTAITASNSLHNYGKIIAGGQGATGGLFIDGSLKHYKGGEIHVDVHPLGAGESHDVITVSGLARMEGEIVTNAKSLMSRDYAFLSAGSLEHSATIRDTHVFDWTLSKVGNTLVKTPTAKFNPAGYELSRNQSALADYLQRSWVAADRSKAPLFGYLHEHVAGDHAGYQQTLDQLSGQVLNSQAILMKTAFSTALSNSLSCPMATPEGLKLNQTSCVWAQVLGDMSEQSSNASNMGFRSRAGGIRLGAQRSLDNQWSTGFGLGYTQNYLTSSGLTSNGQFFDASVSLQKKVSDWTFGGSLAFAQGSAKNNRLPQLFGNGAAEALSEQYKSDARMSMVGLRFRAAHEFDQKNYYIKPYVDLDLIYSNISGYTESGGALALRANSSSQFNVAVTPMIEFGTDFITDGKRRVKAYAAAGASFLPNNNVSTQMAFANGSNLGTFDAITNGPNVLGRLNLGIQAYESNDFEVRAEYGIQAGGGYWNQLLSVNLAYRF